MKIAVIGAGATGVSFFTQIIRQAVSRKVPHLEINVFEKNQSVGRGLAYKDEFKSYILNLPVGTMIPDPNVPNAFHEWLVKKKIRQSDYPPRKVFGDFMQDLFSESSELALKFGYGTTLHSEEVLNLQKEGHKFCVQTSSKEYRDFDAVVLSTGHFLPEAHELYSNDPRFIHFPWLKSSMEKISKNSTVGILGSRQTAVDCALSLIELGHKGRVHMFSRTGRMPCIQGKTSALSGLKFISSEKKYSTLLELWSDLKLEIENVESKAIDWTQLSRAPSNTLAWIESEIQDSESPRAWRQVLLNLHETGLIDKLWNDLPLSEKLLFKSRYFSLWSYYWNSIPRENALKVRELLQSGQLQVHAVSVNPTGLCRNDAAFYEMKTKEGKSFFLDWLINGKGCGKFNPEDGHPLMRNLIQKNWLYGNPLGGLSVDFESLELKNIENRILKNVFAIGPITNGDFFSATALIHAGRQSAQLVRILLQRFFPAS
jgi:uncharacterized NAD(P)/FAD-binding protein YdhS